MKQGFKQRSRKQNKVTLYVRVWIETDIIKASAGDKIVTLYVRVWIETKKPKLQKKSVKSPST